MFLQLSGKYPWRMPAMQDGCLVMTTMINTMVKVRIQDGTNIFDKKGLSAFWNQHCTEI